MISHPSPDSNLHSQAQDWLVLLTSGQATEADARALRQWCAKSPAHAQAFASTRHLWQQLEPAARQASRVLPLRQMGRRAFLGGAIAASAAFVLLRSNLLDGLGQPAADFQTAVGEQRQVALGQDVALELNTQTRISRQGGAAITLLDGEVEVQAQAAVQVQAGAGLLSAQQARFNVRQAGEVVCVTCLSGQVQVLWQGRSLALASGRQLSYDRQQAGEPQVFDPVQVMAWREQLLVFHDTPLSQVIDEINRYRPGVLLLLNPELGRRKVQARFTLAQLPGVAGLIRDAYGVRCTELPGDVVLIS
ncbi:FecR family protein [Pseudomonas fontis]|uniref:DUF4880 domain-containing protein n=1 Tax=Pseudomonas fontis TaxID=2942633 RepID=A0ABT5NPV9_9PSED|nr:DUF4880 domain-containing protein [Pseudomonas fontis]MDD0974703.1 DUF4880 domain-containing protein [Pseudomonas fontis]MDD0990198.1 DUF4880 domain-containing protein [Pseudomonas fontis]